MPEWLCNCSKSAAAVVCGAALWGAIDGAATGVLIGAIDGAAYGGCQGAIDGARIGLLSGTVLGGVNSAKAAGMNIADGTTTVLGSAHGSVMHKIATNIEAGKMAASGHYEQISINRSLRTVGAVGTSRPDIVGVSSSGVKKVVEVVSPKQNTDHVANKMYGMLSDNPDSIGKIVTWVKGISLCEVW